MIKNFIQYSLLGFVIINLMFFGVVNAAKDKVKCTDKWRGCYDEDSTPLNILDDIVENDDSQIIETKLDGVYDSQVFGIEFKMAGTLDTVNQDIAIYLQWMAYLALSFAVIFIIYNGLLLMLSPLSPEQASKVRTRLIYVITGLLVVTGFWFILKVLIAVFVDVFVD